MSDQLARFLWDDVQAKVDAAIEKALAEHRQDLAQTTGTVLGRQLPTTGNTGSGYTPAPHNQAWSTITSTPTTLSGYGITDAASASDLSSEASTRAAADTALAAPQYLTLALSGTLTNERRIVAGTGITLTDGGAGGDLTIAAPGGGGTVTSVNITAPAAGITASGGPITSSGAITLALANDLAALEGLGSTGLAVRSAADTWVQRSIAGTSNRLSVTNGSGAAGNPTLDIDSAYVGQTSITTLGTIGTGAWQGTKVGLAYGGSNADLSATGGANQFLKQSSVGAAITVGALVAGDIPDLSATYQPLDADLTAIAAFSSTGLAARTASNTWAQRTITGTANRITVTNGDGVSGNPTLDISSNYTGQTTITTLGTITSGVWGAVTIGVSVGGTGFGAYTVGDILYASATSAFSKLSDVATGNALISGGVGVAPSYGKIGLTTHVSGILPAGNGGTGVNNAGKLTLATDAAITGGGTLDLGGFTLTAPATGTAALRGVANTFSATQTIGATLDAQQLTHVRVTSGTTGYGIRFWDGANEFGNVQSLDLSGTSYIFFATNRQFDGSAWQQLNTRVGGDLQISGDGLTFNTFPTSSSTPVQQISIGVSGILDARVGFSVGSTQVVTSKQAGWSAPTGTLTRGVFAVSGATTASTAQALAALITDLRTHGLI